MKTSDTEKAGIMPSASVTIAHAYNPHSMQVASFVPSNHKATRRLQRAQQNYADKVEKCRKWAAKNGLGGDPLGRAFMRCAHAMESLASLPTQYFSWFSKEVNRLCEDFFKQLDASPALLQAQWSECKKDDDMLEAEVVNACEDSGLWKVAEYQAMLRTREFKEFIGSINRKIKCMSSPNEKNIKIEDIWDMKDRFIEQLIKFSASKKDYKLATQCLKNAEFVYIIRPELTIEKSGKYATHATVLELTHLDEQGLRNDFRAYLRKQKILAAVQDGTKKNKFELVVDAADNRSVKLNEEISYALRQGKEQCIRQLVIAAGKTKENFATIDQFLKESSIVFFHEKHSQGHIKKWQMEQDRVLYKKSNNQLMNNVLLIVVREDGKPEEYNILDAIHEVNEPSFFKREVSRALRKQAVPVEWSK